MERLPKLRDDLVVSRQEQGGQTVYIVKDPLSDRFFRLREPEFFLAQALDGQTDTAGLLDRFRARFNLDITPEQLQAFVLQLDQKLFLESSLREYELAKGAHAVGRRHWLDRVLYIKLKAFDPQRFLDWLYKHFRFTLTAPFVFLATLVSLAGLLQLRASYEQLPHTLVQIFQIGGLLAVIVAVFVVVALHELAHSLVCRHFGGKVREMGFLLLYFQPCFYSNLSDSYLFPRKSQRVLTTFVGVFFQLFLGSGSLLLWRIIRTGTLISDICFLIASISFLTLLFNLNPLLKLDGYYLLADWVEIPNLRSKAFGYLKAVLTRIFIGPPPPKEPITAKHRRIYLLYALLALIYSAVLLTLVASFLFKLLVPRWRGAGFLLFLGILGIMFNRPIRATLKALPGMVTRSGHSMPKSKRFYTWIGVLVVLIVLAFVVPTGFKITAPCAINPLESFVIKTSAGNLLEAVHTRGGESQEKNSRFMQLSTSDFSVLDIRPAVAIGSHVDSGAVMLEIVSNLFSSQLDQTRAELEKATAQYQLLLSDPKRAEVARSKAALDEAKLQQISVENDYQRAKKLHDKNLISDEDMERYRTERSIQNKRVDIAKSEFDLLKSGPKAEELLSQDAEIRRLKAKVEYLQDQVDACALRAPFAGELTRFGVDGEIFSLARVDSVEVSIQVPESEIDILQIGQPAGVRLNGYPQRTFSGRVVKQLATAQSASTRRFFTAISVISNSDRFLKPGMTGYAKIQCGKTSIAMSIYRKVVRFFRVEFWSWW